MEINIRERSKSKDISRKDKNTLMRAELQSGQSYNELIKGDVIQFKRKKGKQEPF